MASSVAKLIVVSAFLLTPWQAFSKEVSEPRSRLKKAKQAAAPRREAPAKAEAAPAPAEKQEQRQVLVPTRLRKLTRQGLPITQTLVIPYRALGKSGVLKGHFEFTLNAGKLVVTHYEPQTFGFYTPGSKQRTSTPVQFMAEFEVNQEITISSQHLYGEESVEYDLPSGMLTVSISVPDDNAKGVIFEKEFGFLTDAQPLTPVVGEQILVADPFLGGRYLYTIERHVQTDHRGTQYYELSAADGSKAVMQTIDGGNAEGLKDLNATVQQYLELVLRSMAPKQRMISAGANFVIHGVGTDCGAAFAISG